MEAADTQILECGRGCASTSASAPTSARAGAGAGVIMKSYERIRKGVFS